MIKKSTNNEKSVKSLQKGMDDPKDAEFRRFKEWIEPIFIELLKSQRSGKPKELDFRFLKNLIDRINADIAKGLVACISTGSRENLSDIYALLSKRYTEIIVDELFDEHRAEYKPTVKKLAVIIYLAIGYVLYQMTMDNTEGMRALNKEVEN